MYPCHLFLVHFRDARINSSHISVISLGSRYEFVCQAGDVDLISGLGRFPGEGNDNPLQYACLGNPMDGGDWQARVPGVAKNQIQLRE